MEVSPFNDAVNILIIRYNIIIIYFFFAFLFRQQGLKHLNKIEDLKITKIIKI